MIGRIDDSEFSISEPLVRKLLATVDAGLVAGVGVPEPGKMCVEAAISYALGEPHSDGPSCVDGAVRTGKIVLNDAPWSSPQARAAGMRAVAIAQLGAKGTVDPIRYAKRLAELTIREIVPIALRAAARVNPQYAPQLEAAAERCANEGSGAAAEAAAGAAGAAAEAAAWAARAAAEAAAWAARAAAWAARAAAGAAAEAAAWAAAWAARAAAWAARAAAGDAVLARSASLMVQALRECGSPGCEWLWLVEEVKP